MSDVTINGQTFSLTEANFDASVAKIKENYGDAVQFIVPPAFYAFYKKLSEERAPIKKMAAQPKPCDHFWNPDYAGDKPTVCKNCGIEL